MSDPIKLSETVSYWMLSYMCGTKMLMIQNPDINSIGLFGTALAAEQHMLMELLKSPTNRYFIHQINYPFPPTKT